MITAEQRAELDSLTAGEARALLMQYSKEDMITALAQLVTENRALQGEVERLGRELKARGLSRVTRSVADQQREIRELSEQRRNLRGGAA